MSAAFGHAKIGIGRTFCKESVFPSKAYLRPQDLWALGVDTKSRVVRLRLRITVAQTRDGASGLIRSAASSPDASAEWQSLQTQYGSLAWAALTTRGNVHVRPQGAKCMLCGRPIEKKLVAKSRNEQNMLKEGERL